MKKYHINTILISHLPYVLHRPFVSIAELSGISRSTWYKISKQPDTITVQQMLALANGTKIPVRHFLSDQVCKYVGTIDEYVIEDGYLECYYDVAAMRKRIGPGTPITWKAAAEVMQIYWTNASRSLMSERRLPVETLLDICTAFGMDPFEFIVDENVQNRKRKTSSPRNVAPSSAEEIRRLRKEVSDIRNRIERLEAAVKLDSSASDCVFMAAESCEEYNRKK